MIKLKPFQEDAVTELVDKTKDLRKHGSYGARLVFKSPTGSGKTTMMAQYLKDLSRHPSLNVDKCFVWISFGGDTSYMQSYNKLLEYYDGAGEINLLTVNDLSKKKMQNNEVFFINWSKIKSGNKESRRLRMRSEHVMKGVEGGIFDEFIKNTQEDGREIILIVDEAHLEKTTNLAGEIINLINPKLEIHVSATPINEPSASEILNKKAGYVEVKHDKVVRAGLIKDKIITQTKEDIENISENINIDEALLELAIEKRNELKKYYNNQNIYNINPLVLIQIPNKSKKNEELDEEERQTAIKNYLISKAINEQNIAVWLSDKKENLEDIVKNDSLISFLIFKQAVATGWDCPRAHVLVMYREIKNPIFHIQTVGRILRMPQAKHYPTSELNHGYLYTNYKKNEVHESENKQGVNNLSVYTSKRREGIEPFQIKSVHLQRQDYNDLKPADEFQQHLIDNFDEYFDISKSEAMFANNIKKVEKRGLKWNTNPPELDIIIDAKIENYDDLIEQMKDANQMGVSFSRYDRDQLYNKLCYDVVNKQDDDDAKFAPERSYGTLKEALNVWSRNRLTNSSDESYNAIVNDLLKGDSCLRERVSDVLKSFRLITNTFLDKQSERKKREITLEIPIKQDSFTQDYVKVDVKKSAIMPFYQSKNASGIEKEFVNYLESNENVEWWYKNQDNGEDYFSIPYNHGKNLFYPDWFIKLKNRKTILIVDTKDGWTIESPDTRLKIEALHSYLQENNYEDIVAGIATLRSGIWKINTEKIYIPDKNYNDFFSVSELIRQYMAGKSD